MKRILAIYALSLTALFAADPINKPAVITEAQADRLELLAYKARDLQQALDKIHEQQRAYFAEVCKAAGITAPDFAALAQVCSVDLTAKTVTRKEAPLEKK